MEQHSVLKEWLRQLQETKNHTDETRPNYWKDNPHSLISNSSVHSLAFGTGYAIYHTLILPAIERAQSEVIIVTCFWARSKTLDSLNTTLLDLSSKANRRGTKIRVRICFSSSSLFQKLFHTSSLSGHLYTADEWHERLGLPKQEDLTGIDLQVKSIFVLPFSVMHPKFVIIDRSRVFLPSCNVSWEDWRETTCSISGDVTENFLRFWQSFWEDETDRDTAQDTLRIVTRTYSHSDVIRNPEALALQNMDLTEVPTLFLPSPHHRNPQFTLPFQKCPPPPPTPLNAFLLALFANAQRNIYIQTPNLTSPPVLSTLLAALRRGVDVTIITSERLMILEQLVTAGTTTSRCVKRLVKRHRRLQKQWLVRDANAIESDPLKAPGVLTVKFFKSSPKSTIDIPEPVQSHLKITVVDEEWTVFGSGNMDRASWYTSQELGVAFFSASLARSVRDCLRSVMQERTS